MRGFELIMKVLEHITLIDFLKVQKRSDAKHNYHFQKSALVDLEINAQIMEAVETINENNFSVIALATNESS